MNANEVLVNHKSIRVYQDRPIEKDVLNGVLEAGIRAANTGNMQLYSIIVSADKDKKEKLAAFHFNQKMVKEAAVVLTVCVDIHRFHKWCEQRNAGRAYDNFLWFITGTVDASILSQNLCIAAESRGIGTCYLGTVNYNTVEIASFLNLPKGVVPVTCITMGYPAENPSRSDRLGVEAVVHYESYKDPSSEDIDRFYCEKEELPFTKELIQQNETENLAQIFTKKRYKREDNVRISEKLIHFLEQSGFMEEPIR